MQACFSIDADPLTSTVSIAMSGFFEEADIQRFVARRDAEHLRLRCPPNGHVTLVDIRGMNIQSQASVERFAHIIGDPTHMSRRIAFVVETSLARMQIQRAAARRGAGFFLSPEEAAAWLRQPSSAPALSAARRHDTPSSAAYVSLMYLGTVGSAPASPKRTQLHADLLDGPAPWQSLPGPELTAIAELVSRVLASDMSAFSVLDRDWQWLTARCGIDEAKLPREHSFCGRVVDTNEAVIIPDTRADLAYRDHPLVAGAPHIAAYVGVPVIVHGENGVDVLAGSLCAVYLQPRHFEEADVTELRKLAAIAAALVGGRLTALELAELARQREGDLHRLARIHRQLGQAERMAGIGSWRLDLADNSIHWSDQVYAIHDLAVAQTPPLEEAMTFYPDRSRVILTDAITLATEQGRPFDEEIDFVSATGVPKRVRSMGEVELQNGRPVSLIGVFQDVTARYEMEQALRRSADTDDLTGLINRAGFNRALSGAIGTARREQLAFALLLIDLDGFKAVNDRCGHLRGDQVLQTIASTLQASYLDGQVCSRLGGDEFAVIVQGLDEASVAALVETLRHDLRHRIDLEDGTSLMVSGTIGISWFEPGLSERDLLRRADAALYHGKRRQRGTVTSYSPTLDHAICSL